MNDLTVVDGPKFDHQFFWEQSEVQREACWAIANLSASVACREVCAPPRVGRLNVAHIQSAKITYVHPRNPKSDALFFVVSPACTRVRAHAHTPLSQRALCVSVS